MKNRKNWSLALAGAAAGTVSGLFGAGGGLVLVPLLGLLPDVEDQEVFPSSISVILPICIISLAATVMTTGVPWRQTAPYLCGSAIGGCLAGTLGKRIPLTWLHRFLAVLILWGGYRNLC